MMGHHQLINLTIYNSISILNSMCNPNPSTQSHNVCWVYTGLGWKESMNNMAGYNRKHYVGYPTTSNHRVVLKCLNSTMSTHLLHNLQIGSLIMTMIASSHCIEHITSTGEAPTTTMKGLQIGVF